MEKNYVEIYQFIWILPITLIIMSIDIWVILYSLDTIRLFSVEIQILIALFAIFMPIYLLIYSVFFGMSKITFNKKCMRKSLFNKFFVREFLWSEIVEVKRVYKTGASFAWICFSRTPLDIMNYNQILKSKEVIRIIDKKRNRDVISEFCDFEIH